MKSPDPSMATAGWSLLSAWPESKMLVVGGGLTWNSLPLAFRTVTEDPPVEPVGTPSLPIMFVPSALP